MEPKNHPPEGDPPPSTDEWGLPVPPPPSWTAAQDAELGYTAGEDEADPW